MRQIHIIAGPNGAGKSSFARVSLLPQFLRSNEFVNADEIAKIIASEYPLTVSAKAGRLMLKRMKYLVEEGLDFAFETTLSARSYLKFIEQAKSSQYKINLIFLALDNIELAKNRVATRVSKGGHNVEDIIVSRRFKRGIINLKDYLKIVDTALIYEASGLELIEIAKKIDNKILITNSKLWEQINAE